MLDIPRGKSAAIAPLPSIEFLRIELAPLMSGTVRVAVTATTVDSIAEELLDQEVVDQSVSTVDELIALIRAHVRIGATTTCQAHGGLI